jgi:aldehyde:ferredoxin oxidoreductase
MNGFFNRLLRVDLAGRRFSYEDIPDTVLGKTLGGKGLGVHLLATENPPGVDALSPANRFIVTVGPITGTRMWSQSRFAVFSKSPATGGYGESYCGGTLAPKIKGCGVDAVILEGACDALTFLRIDENGVGFHDASALGGTDAFEAEASILEASGEGAGAMVIGPAGEHRVGFACIKSDRWRSLGRGGMGAVLGSKRIKGIAFAGNRKAGIADEALLREVISAISRKGKDSPVTANYQRFGTPNQVKVTNGQNCFPTRYWTSGHFEGWQNLSADYMQEHFEVKRHGCPNCFLQCTKLSKVREGRHAGLELEGPEFETIYALGGLNCLDRLEEVAFLNDLCDRLGLDTMSAGNVSAFAIEAFRRGKTDFSIDYNQPDRMAELFRLVARREGIGAVFADGVKAASERLGLQDVAVHVKGLEPAGFDPRVLKGMGLSYATAARGACHLRGTFYKAELSGEIAKEQIAGKARLHIDYEDRAAIFDSLVLCRFFRDFILWDELAALVRASTGITLDKAGLERMANRITQQTRRFNRREGLGPETDTLPVRFFREKTAEGASLGRTELEQMIAEYDAIRQAREAEIGPG